METLGGNCNKWNRKKIKHLLTGGLAISRGDGYILNFLFANRLQLQADDFQIPPHRQAVSVACYVFGQLIIRQDIDEL
jgi:hypothetical protein